MKLRLTLLALILAMIISANYANARENNDDWAMANTKYLYSAEIVGNVVIQDDEGGSILNNESIRIINLGPIINFEDVDYAPTISADGRTLFYVSNRDGSVLNADDDPSHDFWVAKKNNRLDTFFFEPYNLDPSNELGKSGVNTELNEGAASIAADRQSLYFTGCNRPDGLGSCDIYRTTIEGDKWARPINLGRNVNTKFWDSQPSISPDQSRVFFISNRPGPNSDGEMSEENLDIWYADYDFDLEEWKPAVNLEELNTEEQEFSPFIAADNQTLFFASRGHDPNIGGLDFYMTTYDPTSDSWSRPVNLGEPINTEMDESFISLPASGDVLYFSSTREDLSGFQGNLDVFMAFVPTFFKAVNIVGMVIDECSGENIPAAIEVKNPITGRIFRDTLTTSRTKFELVVSNTDYGDPRDSILSIDFEVSAFNEKYGKSTKTLHVEKPQTTTKQDEAGAIDTEYEVTVTLGQRPVLEARIDEADYITNNKEANPELASFRGLVMEEREKWELYPLLNYVFFPSGSAEIPDRYIMFEGPGDPYKENFADTTILGGTLDKYYHVMNVFAYRLQKNPDVKLEIVGCNDGTLPEEKNTPDLSKNRAMNVFKYFTDVWQISEDRLKVSWRDKPVVPSNNRIDTTGNQENRRVELNCNEWSVTKPVFDRDPRTYPQPEFMNWVMKNGIEDVLIEKRRIEITRGGAEWKTLTNIGTVDESYTWDWKNIGGLYPKDEVSYNARLVVTTHSGAECASEPIEIPVKQVKILERRIGELRDSTLEKYNLILFPFDRSDAGQVNERIMNDYVYNRVTPVSNVDVIGHTDNVGMYDHNERLSKRRSGTVERGINKETKGKYSSLSSTGVGEDEPLYDNSLPEGRFYNRTVQVIIKTPKKYWEDLKNQGSK